MQASMKILLPHQAQSVLPLKEHKIVQLIHRTKTRILLLRKGLHKRELGMKTARVERNFGKVC